MFPNLALHYDFGTDPLLLIRADFQRKKPLLKTFCVFSVLLEKKWPCANSSLYLKEKLLLNYYEYR